MANDELYAFTADQIAIIRNLYEAWKNESGDTLNRPGRRNLQSAKVAIGALTSAASATTALLGKPKAATLNVYSFTSTGSTDTGIDITVYNFAPQAATTDRWTVVERDAFTGKWIITTQFCT